MPPRSCFSKAPGRALAEKFGLSVLAVRLGWCPRSKEQIDEISASEFSQDVYTEARTTPADSSPARSRANGPDGYAVVYATSKPVGWQRYDTEPTVRITGFEPRQQWPEGTEIVLGGR